MQLNALFRSSSYKACEMVLYELRRKVSINYTPDKGLIPIKRLRTLTQIPFGVCDDYSNICLAVMRAHGIPTAIDFIPQWPFRSHGHSWNVLFNNSGKNYLFEIGHDKAGYPNRPEYKYCKVFRNTYSINEDLYELNITERFIPQLFQNLCMKDVTEEYVSYQDIKIKVRNYGNSKYAYLAVFDNQKWTPIHWGKIIDGKAKFKKMGKDIMYLPVCYGPHGIFAVGDPFKCTSKGEIQTLKPTVTSLQNMILTRKFPYLHPPFANLCRIRGGKIQASNDKTFKRFETLHIIEKGTNKFEERIINPDNYHFRYWRYYSPDDSFCNIAELAFFEADSISPTQGRVIGTKGSWYNESNKTIQAVFDNNPLTFFDAPTASDSWVGMDFGRKVSIQKIRYLPRGDGNCIEIGDEYELFYWNDTWKSLGRKTADQVYLTYNNCPSNALFLLHNHTKGIEERIFTYENEEQIWW
ncbi:MAG: discoidin domain-containing protein [Bacteroides sp.]|nr:discoidin domain-containing protein [Bacteroides sp.]